MVSKSSLWAVAISAPLVLSCNATALSGMDVDGGTDDASTSGCVGRQCDVNYNCPSVMGPTTLSGTVTIPAGTLPLYNAKVYIPSGEVPGEPTSGASCDRCDQIVPPDAVTSTTTDINGNFKLLNVPHGTNIPLVIRVGKWRRVVTIDNVSVSEELQPLYDYLARRGSFVDLDNYKPDYLPILSRDVLRRIAAGDQMWETMVPPEVAAMIKKRGFFGYHRPDDA